MSMFVFVCGVLCGVSACVFMFVYLLSNHNQFISNNNNNTSNDNGDAVKASSSSSSSSSESISNNNDNNERDGRVNGDDGNKERAFEDQKLLTDALNYLNIFSIASSSAEKKDEPSSATTTTTSIATIRAKYQINSVVLSPKESDSVAVAYLEKLFTEESKTAKERDKQLKNFSVFVVELSKSFKGTHKELLKQSSIAISNAGKSSDIDLAIDCWWNAIGASLEQFGLDQQSLAESLSNDIAKSIGLILETHSTCSKRFIVEGTTLLTQLKDAVNNADQKLKERDKNRDRLNTVMEKGVPVSVSASLSLSAQSLAGRVAGATGPANTNSASNTAGSSGDTNSADPYQKYITRLEESERSLLESNERLAFVYRDFRVGMTKVVSDLQQTAVTALIELEKTLLKYVHSTTNAYSNSEAIIQSMRELIQAAGSTPSTAGGSSANTVLGYESSLREVLVSGSTNSSASFGQLDLGKEAAAILAAAPPSRVPRLPGSFQHSIGRETCVWFNAFTGRIYRDIASSLYFHNWFCTKTSNVLNKGKRPDYIDEFRVVDVEFGVLPPLLMNVQWSTHAVGANVAPTQSGVVNVGVGPGRSSSKSPNSRTGTQFVEEDYDVECTADLALRSGIKVKIETKLWINWPSEHYASINVMLILEVSEITGRVKFGVDRGSTFLSFIGEPHTRFRVHSEIGKQFKLKDVPKLSSFMVKKIKEFIRKKFVYPNCHRFRLAWPRNWWPSGTENNFMPASARAAQHRAGEQAPGTVSSLPISSEVGPNPSSSVDTSKNNHVTRIQSATIANASTSTKTIDNVPVAVATEISPSVLATSVSTTGSASVAAPAPISNSASQSNSSSVRIPSMRGTLSNWLGMKPTTKAAKQGHIDYSSNPSSAVAIPDAGESGPTSVREAFEADEIGPDDVEDGQLTEVAESSESEDEKKWRLLVLSLAKSYEIHFRGKLASDTAQSLNPAEEPRYHPDDNYYGTANSRRQRSSNSHAHGPHITSRNSEPGTRTSVTSINGLINEPPLFFRFIPSATSLQSNEIVLADRESRLNRGAQHTISQSRFHRSWSVSDFRPEYIDALAHNKFHSPAVDVESKTETPSIKPHVEKSTSVVNIETPAAKGTTPKLIGKTSAAGGEQVKAPAASKHIGALASLFDGRGKREDQDPKTKSTGGKLDWLTKAKDKAKDKYSQFKAKHFAAHDEPVTGGSAQPRRQTIVSSTLSQDASPIRPQSAEESSFGEEGTDLQHSNSVLDSTDGVTSRQSLEQPPARTSTFDDGSTSEYFVRVKLAQPSSSQIPIVSSADESLEQVSEINGSSIDNCAPIANSPDDVTDEIVPTIQASAEGSHQSSETKSEGIVDPECTPKSEPQVNVIHSILHEHAISAEDSVPPSKPGISKPPSRSSSILGNFKLPTSPSKLEDFFFGEDASRQRSSSLSKSTAPSRVDTAKDNTANAVAAKPVVVAKPVMAPVASDPLPATEVSRGNISTIPTESSEYIRKSDEVHTNSGHPTIGGASAGLKFVSMLKSKAADKKNSFMRVLSNVAQQHGHSNAKEGQRTTSTDGAKAVDGTNDVRGSVHDVPEATRLSDT